MVEGARLTRLPPEVQRKLIDGLHREVGSRTISEWRDEVLLGLLELRSCSMSATLHSTLAAGRPGLTRSAAYVRPASSRRAVTLHQGLARASATDACA